jgi:NAD(P)-dependent dehydrogenase (short-subunit alcohol dehydrogenase family)
MDLGGKVAIVTGGNRGIGLAIAQGLCASGGAVAIWGRDRERNRAAARACSEDASRASAFECDVQDAGSIQRALAQTLERFGRVDGLFANAGIGGGGRTPFHQQDESDWMRMIDINVLGARRVIAPVLAQMLVQSEAGPRRGGRIVLTSSVAARLGTAYNEHYAASKVALVAIARGLAVEFGRHGITANALLPGYVRTEMTEDLMENDKFREAMLRRLPLRRFAEPGEIAGIAIYLMSDLSAYHTGDVITVDGAFSIS